MAGLPSFSCRPTQYTKTGTKAKATASRAMLMGCSIEAVLPVTDLKIVSAGMSLKHRHERHAREDIG